MLDSVFEIKNDERVAKYSSRISAIEGVLIGNTKPSVSTRNTKSTKPQDGTVNRSTIKLPLLHNSTYVPGIPNEPVELLSYAVDFFYTIFSIVSMNPLAKIRIYRPFIWTNVYSMVIEFVDIGEIVGTRVYCRPYPIPVDSVSLGLPLKPCYCTERTAVLHLMSTSMWRLAMRDPHGAEYRRSMACLMMKRLAHTKNTNNHAGVATEYAGTQPVVPIMERYMRRRAMGSGRRPIKIVIGKARGRNSVSMGVEDTSGSMVSEHKCADVSSKRDLAYAIKKAIIDGTFNDALDGELQKVLRGK
jgi:hypothetical protein